MTFLLAILIYFMPACASEDANNCYWDASTQGNGEGSSFLVINDNVYYL